MQSLIDIIGARGGFDRLAAEPITVRAAGFMPLGIERIGTGERGGALVAVHHTYEQNGDLMFDPEVVFEVAGSDWQPVSFEVSGMCFWNVVYRDKATHALMVRVRLLQDLAAFCRQWDANIRAQGLVDAARKPAPAPAT